jgi:hypothetical protein
VTPGVKQFTSLKDLCVAALQQFSPAQLVCSSERLGPAGTFSPKEAIYHFELYRVLHNILEGSLYPIPEYGKGSNNSIDLMIPTYQWGIEILLDGRKITEHVERFNCGVHMGLG